MKVVAINTLALVEVPVEAPVELPIEAPVVFPIEAPILQFVWLIFNGVEYSYEIMLKFMSAKYKYSKIQ